MISSKKFMDICREFVADYHNEHRDKTDNLEPMVSDDVYIVWYCKTLQNHKALLSTPVPDGMYYECTYNGDKDEIYLDAYKKFQNECIKLDKKEEK